MISTPLIVLKSKACDWLITRIRKEFTSKNTKEKISCGVDRTEEISHQSCMNNTWCEIRTCMGWCEIRTCMVFSHEQYKVRNLPF